MLYKENKMKKIILLLIALIFTTSSYAEVKIGIVKVEKILKEAPQTQLSNKKLEKEFKGRSEKLKKQLDAIQAKEEEFKKNSLTMSDGIRDEKQKDLQVSKIDFQREERELREDIDIKRREEINETIEALAKKQKYDLILYNGVAYAEDKIDITDAVIKALGTVK
jgi:outer membrane protein